MTSKSLYTIQLRFAHALAIVRAIPQNSTLQPIAAADKLQFYGLYKQATEGDVNIPRPSSRQVVDYAKWKAWSRMKGMSPIEAQKLYVESLIQLLTELVHRYPHHELVPNIKKALSSLEYDDISNLNIHNQEHDHYHQEDDDLFQDAYDDTTEFELQEHFLNDIAPDQIINDDTLYSPPNSATVSSFHLTPRPSLLDHKYYNTRHNHFSDAVHTPVSNDYPLTPITSPGQNAVTGQWVLNQLQQQKQINNTKKTYVHPMDFLQEQQQQQQQQDLLSEADTIDREVAATTANLTLSSPRQSPYSSLPTPISTAHKKKLHQISPQLSSTSTSTSSHKNTSNNEKTKDTSRKIKKADRALERLQTEVTALTEQIDRLRRSREDRDRQLRRWSTFGITKILIKHLLANSAIFLIAFYILWKRKSPIAHSIIGYIMPIIQELMRKIIQKVVFWKVTV